MGGERERDSSGHVESECGEVVEVRKVGKRYVAAPNSVSSASTNSLNAAIIVLEVRLECIVGWSVELKESCSCVHNGVLSVQLCEVKSQVFSCHLHSSETDRVKFLLHNGSVLNGSL